MIIQNLTIVSRLIFVLLCMLMATQSVAQHAEAVWVESGESANSILSSELQDDEWGAPIVIHSGENPISRPTMTTLLDGRQILIWSEQQPLKSVLMIMRKGSDSDVWQAPELFSAFGAENTGASMVTDLKGQLWVFWAANIDGGLDDIYYVTGGVDSWTEPERINAENEVPDHLPEVVNLANGDLELSWLSFSLITSAYQTENRIFELDVPVQRLVDSEAQKKERVLADVSLPSELDSTVPGVVHFPDNRLVQTFLVNNYDR